MKDPIDLFSLKIAKAIKRANPEETVDVEVMDYSISLLTNMLLTTMFILTIGFVSGRFMSIVIILSTFASLRFLAGGVHLKSLTLCVVFTTVYVIAISMIPLNEVSSVSIMFFYLVMLWIKSSAKIYVKVIVSLFMALNLFIMDLDVTLGCLAHGLTLLRNSHSKNNGGE